MEAELWDEGFVVPDRTRLQQQDALPGSLNHDSPIREASPTTSEEENLVLELEGSDGEVEGEQVVGMDIDVEPTSFIVLESDGETEQVDHGGIHQYEDDDAKDIFDDGISGDEDYESGSNDSTNYEELSEADTYWNVEETEISQEQPQIQPGEVQGHSEINTGFQQVVAPSSPPKLSFFELQKQQYKELYVENYRVSDYGLGGKSIHSLDEKVDMHRWELLALEEQKKHIEAKICEARNRLGEAKAEKHKAETKINASFEAAGISQELFQAYQEFCESLLPEFGQRGGFSITCSNNHDGSYVKYDPEFELFKEAIEMPLADCNFRCEASTLTSWGREQEYIVEFWPLKSPEPLTETASTWGEQYPDLYIQATSAAIGGSAAAVEMLISLPAMNSSFKGGWMFDYQFEPALKDEPVISRRWRFNSAHEIEDPVTDEEKLRKLELILGHESQNI